MHQPTVVRPAEGRLKVWVPYRAGGWRSTWSDAGLRPIYERPYWRLNRERLAEIVNALFDAGFSSVTLEVWGHETQVCDERCQMARGLDCVCVCAGRYHGGGLFGVPIGETLRLVDEGLRGEQFVLTSKLRTKS